RTLPPQPVDDAIAHELIRDVHAQQPARSRTERSFPEHFRHHLAETLEPGDFGRCAIAVLAVLLQYGVFVRIVEGPERFFPNIDAVERWLREKYLPACQELRKVAIDKREEQGCDVVAVGIGIRQDNQLSVPKPRELEVLAQTAAEGGDEIRQFLVLEHLCERCALCVEHLAAQWQDRLPGAVP